jgi:hypothetical protein
VNRGVRAAFEKADELEGPARAGFLRELAAGEPALHAEVLALLEASEAAGGFLECLRPNERSGERVGPFTVLGELGRGGFCLVQRARQHTPVQREVALKRLSSAAGGPAVVARFEAERQTLAGLSHPHIARFFEAGIDSLGQPWLAMELVEGLPVTTYVKTHGLARDEVIRLFLTICQAITHAHRKGIIHRDLKPSNLLVDAAGHAWVIDFGIAKVLEPLVPETAELTLAGQMIGTPLYMAPERFEGVSDTRADVYALGILLGELLTGRLLRQAETFWKLGPQAWARHLRETPVTAPRLGGDLDAILLKSIQSEPALRYGSVQEFADDLMAYLENAPVRARPPSLFYYSGKFVRRHRLLFGAATLALAGLITGLVFALQSAADARIGRAQAEASRDRATGVTEALSLLISSSNPEVSAGKPLPTMAEALDRFSVDLPRIVKHRPLVEQDVRLVLGEAWLGQGLLEKSEAEFRTVMELEKITGSRKGEALQSLAIVAVRGNKPAEAARILALPEAGSATGAVNTMLNLCMASYVSRHNGDLRAARKQIEAAFQISKRENLEVLQPDCAVKPWRSLVWLEQDENHLPEAEAAAKKMVSLAELGGPATGAFLAEARGILAGVVLAQRQDPEALKMLEESWRAFAHQYGEGHSFTLGFRLLLATHLRSAGQLEPALAHARFCLDAAEALPQSDPERVSHLLQARGLLGLRD